MHISLPIYYSGLGTEYLAVGVEELKKTPKAFLITVFSSPGWQAGTTEMKGVPL
jgi:hypothetical protein